MSQNRFSRRQFVTAAITGAGVFTGRSALGGQPAAGSHHLPARWHGCSDVIVIGFGAAGAAAAYEAAAAGAHVTLLDTTAGGGGDTKISGGYVFIGGGTALQKAAGYSESPEEMFTVVRAMGGPGADPENIRVWCESGPDLFDWLATKIGLTYTTNGLVFGGMEQHAEFRALANGAKPIPHSHVAEGGVPFQQGEPLFAKLSTAALASSRVHFKPRTKATRLIQDPMTKRILGVAARSVDATGAFSAGSTEEYYLASQGVVVATGAFSANPGMLTQHSPNLTYFNHWSQANADGSGIQMVQRAGGDLRLMKAFWALVFFAAESITPKGLLVSTRGSRFVAEDGGYTWLAHYLIAEQQTAYLIFDAKVATGVEPDANALTGETIDELVAAINARDNVGMAPELLNATVDAYNSLAHADGISGRDPAFKKAPEHVVPLLTPPYYAIRHSAMEAFGTTAGGLRVSPRAEVLDPSGAPIPGLFAAGTCANLTLSERYSGGGTAIAGALVFGRIAGQKAARLEAWHRSPF